MNTSPEIMIIGAGVTGLVAAIEAAERGIGVTVAEAHALPGGRARTLAGPYLANMGPHAVYVDGPWWEWLDSRGLTPPIVAAPPLPGLVKVGGRIGGWPDGLSAAIAGLPAQAPAGERFRDWLLRHLDAATAEAVIGLCFIFTFDHDPGRLSAEFVRERMVRSLSGGARYVTGGWTTLVDLLAAHATGLGVDLRTGTRATLQEGTPTIVATSLAAARQLTGDGSLAWTGTRVVTIDLGLRTAGGPDWFRVMDLDDRIYTARYSLADPSLAPDGHELIQISASCRPNERKADAEARVWRLLDATWPGWRAALRWQRSALRTDCTGAVDLPGTGWQDRPAVGRGGDLAVATDQSAAPGLLSEVGVEAARQAVLRLAGAASAVE